MKIFWSEEGLNEDYGVHVEPASLPPIYISNKEPRLDFITEIAQTSEETISPQEWFSHQHFSILIDYAFMLIMPFLVLRTR